MVPEVVDKLVIEGAATTEKFGPLLTTPPTVAVTATLPLTPVGTVAVMLVVVQGGMMVAVAVPNFTVLEP